MNFSSSVFVLHLKNFSLFFPYINVHCYISSIYSIIIWLRICTKIIIYVHCWTHNWPYGEQLLTQKTILKIIRRVLVHAKAAAVCRCFPIFHRYLQFHETNTILNVILIIIESCDMLLFSENYLINVSNFTDLKQERNKTI